MTKEIWKEIPGYDGMYEVSNFGRILSKVKNCSVHIPGEYRKSLINSWQYGDKDRVTLCKKAKNNRHYVSDLVASAFLENTENKPYVAHLNYDRTDNRALNLYFSDTDEEYVLPEPIERTREYFNDMEKLITPIMLTKSVPFYVDATLQYVEYDIDDIDEGLVVYSDVTYRITKSLARECIDKLNDIGIRHYTLRVDKENYHYVTQHCIYLPKNRGIKYSGTVVGHKKGGVKKDIEPTVHNSTVPITQYTLDGEFVRDWPGIRFASHELGLAYHSINADKHNKRGIATGFLWKNTND